MRIAFCNQLCQIGAGIEDLPLENIELILLNLSIKEVARMCMTHSSIRNVCKSAKFKMNYLLKNGYDDFFHLFLNVPTPVSAELDVELAGWIHAMLKYTTFTTDTNNEFTAKSIIEFAKDYHLVDVLGQLIKDNYISFADAYSDVPLKVRMGLQAYFDPTYELPYDKINYVIVGDIWLVDRIVESNDYNSESFIRTIVDRVVKTNIYNIDRWLIHLKSKIPEIDVAIVDACVKYIASSKITLNINRDSKSISKLVNILIKVYPDQIERLTSIILEKALIFAYTISGIEVLQYFILRVQSEKIFDLIFKNDGWWSNVADDARNTLVVWCNRNNLLSVDNLNLIILIRYKQITKSTLNELCQTNNFIFNTNTMAWRACHPSRLSLRR